MLAAAAEVAHDRRGVDLAEELVEAAWQLLRYLTGEPGRAKTQRRNRH